jgi:hypothetical protein
LCVHVCAHAPLELSAGLGASSVLLLRQPLAIWHGPSAETQALGCRALCEMPEMQRTGPNSRCAACKGRCSVCAWSATALSDAVSGSAGPVHTPSSCLLGCQHNTPLQQVPLTGKHLTPLHAHISSRRPVSCRHPLSNVPPTAQHLCCSTATQVRGRIVRCEE